MSINWKFPTQPLKFDEKKMCQQSREKKKVQNSAAKDKLDWNFLKIGWCREHSLHLTHFPIGKPSRSPILALPLKHNF